MKSLKLRKLVHIYPYFLRLHLLANFETLRRSLSNSSCYGTGATADTAQRTAPPDLQQVVPSLPRRCFWYSLAARGWEFDAARRKDSAIQPQPNLKAHTRYCTVYPLSHPTHTLNRSPGLICQGFILANAIDRLRQKCDHKPRWGSSLFWRGHSLF